MSVFCLLVFDKNHTVEPDQFSVHVDCGFWSVLFLWHYNKLCTSSHVYDIKFSQWALWCIVHVFLSSESTTANYCINSNQIVLKRVHIVGCCTGGWSLLLMRLWLPCC